MSRFEDHEDLQMLQDKEISARPQNHVLLELERTLEIVKSSCLVLTMKKKNPEMDSDFPKVTQLVRVRSRPRT